jgi:hypothetical protein
MPGKAVIQIGKKYCIANLQTGFVTRTAGNLFFEKRCVKSFTDASRLLET